ncbi:hypothetical protein GCM10007242_44790 [Pigmentiphaga litoralis]|uniref:hypothetical protein n=1 Tax=Pigmentiphaga litoralis TaxID=516702 RepID=UPI0016794760|nr:hypothetical protein [Pigmentiphaga litoralis]GGX32856.1 hypothetical protein GCM10007242_44790 [Pigmentiphaga litoralis]
MTITPINKTVACRMEALTVNADGSLLARYTVGIVDDAGAYKPIADKNYMLSAADAAPILDSKTTKDGKAFDQLSAALVTALSQRPDWIA